jgi:hypothetical protein
VKEGLRDKGEKELLMSQVEKNTFEEAMFMNESNIKLLNSLRDERHVKNQMLKKKLEEEKSNLNKSVDKRGNENAKRHKSKRLSDLGMGQIKYNISQIVHEKPNSRRTSVLGMICQNKLRLAQTEEFFNHKTAKNTKF